jgi:hypothetical protein
MQEVCRLLQRGYPMEETLARIVPGEVKIWTPQDIRMLTADTNKNQICYRYLQPNGTLYSERVRCEGCTELTWFMLCGKLANGADTVTPSFRVFANQFDSSFGEYVVSGSAVTLNAGWAVNKTASTRDASVHTQFLAWDMYITGSAGLATNPAMISTWCVGKA